MYALHENTHIRGLLVVIDVVDVSRQTEVGYFHHVVFRHQNVASGEISVDALNQQKETSLGLKCPRILKKKA